MTAGLGSSLGVKGQRRDRRFDLSPKALDLRSLDENARVTRAGEVAPGGVSGLPDNGNVAVARARGQLRPEGPDRGLASKFEA
jgi:hypothetical protein